MCAAQCSKLLSLIRGCRSPTCRRRRQRRDCHRRESPTSRPKSRESGHDWGSRRLDGSWTRSRPARTAIRVRRGPSWRSTPSRRWATTADCPATRPSPTTTFCRTDTPHLPTAAYERARTTAFGVRANVALILSPFRQIYLSQISQNRPQHVSFTAKMQWNEFRPQAPAYSASTKAQTANWLGSLYGRGGVRRGHREYATSLLWPKVT